jgi:hypothetical protein
LTAALDTYAELRLAEGKLLHWGEREAKAACALQPRDLEILVALARYWFLTTGQIAELWWKDRGLRAVRRRITRLFDAGFVERFRPQTLRGAYQWTYCLARDGFRAAAQIGELSPALKFAPRREAIFDYRYVIHDLRTNEWVLRYRELLGDRLLEWAGPDESRLEPPKKTRDEAYMSLSAAILGGSGWHDADIHDDWFRPVQPDALLDVAATDQDVRVFVEYDRTRRVDKNYDKFRRYETLITVWWRATDLGLSDGRLRLPGRRASAPLHACRRLRVDRPPVDVDGGRPSRALPRARSHPVRAGKRHPQRRHQGAAPAGVAAAP